MSNKVLAVKKLLIATLVTTSLSGCVIAIHDGEEGHRSSWEVRQQDNRAMISQLMIGENIEKVVDRLGPADDTEGFEIAEKSYVVLFYRTRHKHEDGLTTRDETTPLIFQNGKLLGWGDTVLAKYQP
ncbi:MAG: DUF3192 domain-containing protein [Gammaproteobacteria bacterium]|nr:DUF3192 domain-containing protein [Gammaproteobacteria bacterium]